MQTCSGSRCRSAIPGEHRLVTLAIRVPILAMDVGREWNMAEAFKPGKEIRHRSKSQSSLAELPARNNLGLEQCTAGFVSKAQTFSHPNLASGAHQRLPFVVPELPSEKNLYFALQKVS